MATKEIEQLSELEFAKVFQAHRRKILEDPITYFFKASGYLNFHPSLAQLVALKMTFGKPLDNTIQYSIPKESRNEKGEFCLQEANVTELDIYKEMTGKDITEEELGLLLNYLDFIVGRRGGKTTLAGALASFCTIKEDWTPFLKKTPQATVLILSPTKELSQEILQIVRAFFDDSPILNRLIDLTKKNTQSTFNVKVPFIKLVEGKEEVYYSRVQIKVGAASKKTTRGIAACAVLCDEISYWGTDEKFAETDVEILRAVKPSQMQFKDKFLLIKLSSPGIKQGVLYDEYQRRFELPKNYAVFKAPSWIWNPSMVTENFLKTELELDPTGFASEYRGDFVDTLSDFISPELVDQCIVKSQLMLAPESKGSDVTYTAVIDAAFKGDRFAFTIMGQHGPRIKQYILKTWKGSRAEPLKAKEVAQFISTICKDYGISRVNADQFAFQPLKEIFEQFGLTLIENPFTNNFKKLIYYNLKSLVHNVKVDLLDNPINIMEIKQLKVEQSSTGTVRIGHPIGGHDDAASVTAVGAYLLVNNINKGGMIDQSEIAGSDYGLMLDAGGKTITQAPSAEMLGEMYGDPVENNASQYRYDPETGEYKLIEEDEDEDRNGEIGGDFIFS